MKKRFINISKILTISSLLLFASCDNYLDVNKDLNNPTIDELNPENLMSAAQTTTATTLGTRMNQLGNIMTTGWSANATDFASPFDTEFRYDITNTFYSDIWSNLYLRCRNFDIIEKYNDPQGGNWDNHRAIAKIMKAFYFQYLVDLYGDIPYSEKYQVETHLFPKYDDDKDIYRNLVVEVEDAIQLINSTDPSTVKTVNSDVIYQGNMNEWVKFANTLKLRLLIRQTTLLDAATTTYLTNEFAELNGATFVNSDVLVNPGYLNAAGKQNPFYSTYGFTSAGLATSTNNLVGPSNFYADLLNGSIPGVGVIDARLNRQFTPRSSTAPLVVGVDQGASTGRTSKLGVGVLKSSEQDLVLMSASESYFLQAEAVERGYLPGSAQSLFQQGIRKSFEYLGLTVANANSYIASSNGVSRIGWGSGNNLEAIITQKWIANNSINGIESWIELTRTGYPSSLPLPLTTTATSRPIRLLYPDSEYSGNSNNVPNQISSDAFTSKVFWKL